MEKYREFFKKEKDRTYWAEGCDYGSFNDEYVTWLEQQLEKRKVKKEQCNIHDVSCRNSVNWFAGQMELKLRDNDHKGGWGKCEHNWLLDRLKQEVEELEKTLDQVDNQENVIKEAADVANFALMIADLAGRLYGT